jgi:hypothetical protein
MTKRERNIISVAAVLFLLSWLLWSTWDVSCGTSDRKAPPGYYHDPAIVLHLFRAGRAVHFGLVPNGDGSVQGQFLFCPYPDGISGTMRCDGTTAEMEMMR